MNRPPSPYELPPEQPINRVPERRANLGLIGIVVAGLAAFGALTCLCVIGYFVFVAKPPPSPAAPTPGVILQPSAIVPTLIVPTAVISTNPNAPRIGQFFNPYDALGANLAGMTIIQIDVRDATTGSYTRAAQLTGADITPFDTAFNVAVTVVAQDSTCVDDVRMSITRADNSVVIIGACLKGSVILRSNELFGAVDLPMYPGFTDALSKYLPTELQQRLTFN